jgi:hypothetical protein
MGGDPFDLKNLRVDLPKLPLKRRKQWRRQFVRVPWEWVERLRPARRVSTYQLALLLAYEYWRQGGRPIVLSNVAAEMPRRSKWRALVELESMGLIRIERRSRKAPLVTLHGLPAAIST